VDYKFTKTQKNWWIPQPGFFPFISSPGCGIPQFFIPQETEKSRARTSRSRERAERAERAERERGFQPRSNRATWEMPRGW